MGDWHASTRTYIARFAAQQRFLLVLRQSAEAARDAARAAAACGYDDAAAFFEQQAHIADQRADALAERLTAYRN